MSINVLNAHGQQIHVLPKHNFQRGKQPVSTQRGNSNGSRWAPVACAPVKFVNISRPIFSTCFCLTVAVCVACAAYFAVLLQKNSDELAHLIAGILVSCILYILFVLIYKVKNETIVLIPSFGIQLEQSYALGRHSTQFIPYADVKDVVINEAISMYKVIYYLVLLVKSPTSETSVIPLFTHSWPRLDILCGIYNVCQGALQQENIHPASYAD